MQRPKTKFPFVRLQCAFIYYYIFSIGCFFFSLLMKIFISYAFTVVYTIYITFRCFFWRVVTLRTIVATCLGGSRSRHVFPFSEHRISRKTCFAPQESNPQHWNCALALPLSFVLSDNDRFFENNSFFCIYIYKKALVF